MKVYKDIVTKCAVILFKMSKRPMIYGREYTYITYHLYKTNSLFKYYRIFIIHCIKSHGSYLVKELTQSQPASYI